ncbi:MAG TPA: alpha/beta hydrolase [Bacillus sp. (in: firmicutes)]|nr:alpha/beta hydrolase [Bacillus sp. (in: firmicutes)]
MPFFMTDDDVNIYYRVKGEGTPIIFIHGWLSNHKFFFRQEQSLSAKLKIVTFDLRDHGKSGRGKNDLTLHRFALDVKQLMEHLDLRDAVIFGWSMGASVFFEYVKSFGTSRLSKACIIDMSPKLINEEDWDMGLYHGTYTHEDNAKDLSMIRENWLDFVSIFMKRALPYFGDPTLNPMLAEKNKDLPRLVAIAYISWLELVGTCMRKAFPYLESAIIKPVMEDLSTDSPQVLYETWTAMTAADYRTVLPAIDVPTLIVHGKKSTLYSKKTAQYLHSRIPCSQLVQFESCTHFLLAENSARLNKAVETFALETGALQY